MKIEKCSIQDYLWIYDNLEKFWGDRRTEHIHHPMFVNEFGDTAYVIRNGNEVIGYLFAFFSQTENAGYIHAVGVNQSSQRKGIGRLLYEHFFEVCKTKNIEFVKAITTPKNKLSINFHVGMGFELVGPDLEGEIPIVKNYSGSNNNRVIMKKTLSDKS